MAESCNEGNTANQRKSVSEGHRYKTWLPKRLFTAESPLKYTLLLVMCVHNINSCVRHLVECTFLFHMSSINKRSTRLVATFIKRRFAQRGC